MYLTINRLQTLGIYYDYFGIIEYSLIKQRVVAIVQGQQSQLLINLSDTN